MIGSKKLSEIRKQVEEALTPDHGDPIQRLDRRIAAAKRRGDRTEVMEGPKKFLETAPKRQRRKRGA